MTIREKFLNKNLVEISYEGNEFNEQAQNRSDLKSTISKIRNKLQQGFTSSQLINENSKEVNLSQEQLVNIINLYEIHTSKIEDRDFIKEIINKVNFDSGVDYPVVFMHNLLIINTEVVNKFLHSKNTNTVLRELTQLLCLIKLEKVKSLKEITTIQGLDFDYNDSFTEVLTLEDKIINKIKQSINFSDLTGYLSPLEKDFIFKEEGRLIYENVVFDLEVILIKSPENDNLIEFQNDKICFNMHSLDAYTNYDLNEDRKRELIQAFSLIINEQQTTTSNYSQLLFNQKGKILSLLERKVSEEDVDSAITKMPGNKKEFTQVTRDKILNLLKVNEKDRFIIFEKGYINPRNLEVLMTEEFKNEQIITYFIIECHKENTQIECKLLNNKTIKFNEFETIFYIEDLLQKELTNYSLSDILQTIHEFKKDKIFNSTNEAIIDNVISENFVQKFSYNKANREIIFINQSRCVFNEKVISQINGLEDAQLLEMYVLTQDTLVKELNENISVDKRITNLKKYQSVIIDKLKYKITEKEIIEAIESIEEKSNTLIQSKDKVFQEMSIELNAKEVKEIANDIVIFEYRDKELFLYSFNESICSKLLKKELTDLSKREFAQALLLYELKNKKTVIRNTDGEEFKIHDNFKQMSLYVDNMTEKLLNKIKEEDINNALDIITNKVSEDVQISLQPIITTIKKRLGIKVQSSFKHIL